MSKNLKIIIGIVFLFISLVILLFSYYIFQLTPTSSKEDMVQIEIPKGASGSKVANILKENNLIRSELIFRVYIKIHNTNNINYGIYDLNEAMGVKQIVEIITDAKASGNTILFREGLNMWNIAKVISEYTNNTEEDVYALLDDEEYIDGLINDYWFITEDIKAKDIYYPLEGYLAPNTYQFADRNVSVEVIFESMLNQMGKVLTPYKDKLGNHTIHEVLTLASMIEAEGKTLEDRKNIAGVFYNRLAIGDSLGSDVTTYYAIKLDNYASPLKTIEINTYNPYNTRGPRMAGLLPVGPICSPSESSIVAAIEPIDNDYLFFVADKNGKIYFMKTYAEHNAKIKELKAKKLWCEF
ncbi:MAG: endolytic transglycosylase MltG [Bacilli bacterium]|nr:endolytic transglycosylase MltG [Bacilli bacterium]MDD3305033.1 endolytic transglycosylase MltG [Bacilli bacterium]MDD4053636.1 endolytic transglycosylase MltG [Bacilli bacterium]MDD4411135.1 endolytic transglycosylase MltG [Bacilli bacterium]